MEIHKPGTGKIMEAANKTRGVFPLQYLQEHEATFMLGMYLAPDGNNKDQVKYLHKKATAWETSIIVRGVQHNEAWKALNSTIPPHHKIPLICHITQRGIIQTHHVTHHRIWTQQVRQKQYPP